MYAFWLSMVMIFLAELGDKTQLVALTMATRYNAKIVLWGIWPIGILVTALMAYLFLFRKKTFKTENETSKEAAAGKVGVGE